MIVQTVIEMTKAVEADPKIVENEAFAACWRFAACDFANFAHKYNVGNASGNLRQSGRSIDGLLKAIRIMSRDSSQIDPGTPGLINIKRVLSDLKTIAHKAEFEFDRNTVHIKPDSVVSVYGSRKEYVRNYE